MAIKKACLVTTRPKNTGKQCDSAMVATSMVVAMDRGLIFDDDDLADPVTWLTLLIHQKKAFPLFGQKAPIREIKNNKEADVIVTLDDGTQVFLRYGVYNRQLATTQGGLCYAEALQSFLNSGMDLIEIDQQGQLLARDNGNNTYSPLLTSFMYGPSPDMADFKNTPYKNWFAYSFDPTELVNNGIIFNGAQALMSLQGLIDASILKAAAATTTKLKIWVKTTCSEDDLIAKFGATLGSDPTNFYVEDVAVPGVAVTITGSAIVGSLIELTGTFTSAHTYRVWGTSPETWLGNLIEGYDASENYVDILIP